jgi:hypothetical protein
MGPVEMKQRLAPQDLPYNRRDVSAQADVVIPLSAAVRNRSPDSHA